MGTSKPTREASPPQPTKKEPNYVLIISAVIVIAFVLFGILAPDALAAASDALFAGLTGGFGWLYLLVVFLLVIYAVAIGVSKYGHIKLGHDDDKPEFSNF